MSGAKRLNKEGLLSKQGGVMKTWKKRHFILKHGHLQYFVPQSKVAPAAAAAATAAAMGATVLLVAA